ncbi:YggT family protein [Herbiconiux moechotypicola]|uniref:YggT family protein n=1 Tax=Herbiconiux moechotypicola TaxID=637393 RepID=A0ABN3DQ65_9MICO|nr:YggT family protein [Herbiconiux moechotypicola]MCS5730485.1 YggT family protein [Herbiconiux moechotypicola]
MGSLVSIVATVVYFALLLYFFLMWGRFVLDLVRTVRRDWRPTGALLVLAEVTYTVTDPPIRFFRRIIPPLRLGAVALDFGWSIVMLIVIIAMSVAGFFRAV